MMKVHKNWGKVEYWQAIKRTAPPYTLAKYLKGMDMYYAADGSIAQVEEDRRIHRILWLRTLEIAFFVTVFCFNGISYSSFIGYITNEVLKSVDDLCSSSILDFIISQNCKLDDITSTTRCS